MEQGVHPLLVAIGACYVASSVTEAAVGIGKGAGLPLNIQFADLGVSNELLAVPVFLRDAALAGAGAVGNAFLRALRHLKPSGSLTVADPKRVAPGNPNRCLYFDNASVGKWKAEELCERAKADLFELKLEPFVGTLTDLARRLGRVRRVIVGTDSRRVRRTIQSEIPLEVLDASTTGVDEVIVHSHRQPTGAACLSCIYRHVDEENALEKDIAEGLGIDVSDIEKGLIDEEVANKIIASHPGLEKNEIIGVAFDSLFRRVCAAAALKLPTGDQVFAPFAFVSSLAGALLAIELLRFDSEVPPNTNYFVANPWRPPNPMMRRRRPKVPDCVFCSRPEIIEAMNCVWADVLQ